jgi:hypothetical protein
MGKDAMYANTTGAYNTAVGASALDANVTGNYNTAFGYNSLTANTGEINTAFGGKSLASNTSGSGNTAIGWRSLEANVTNHNNTAVGYHSLTANTGSDNVAVGSQALNSNTSGNYNTAVGQNCLTDNTTGQLNTAFGYAALANNIAAVNNTAVGYLSLWTNTTGHSNVAVGSYALDACTTGASNCGIGKDAAGGVTTGNHNIGIGNSTLVDTVVLTTGSHNIAIGNFSRTTDPSSDYATVIGYNVAGAAGYTTLGRDASEIRAAHGNVTWATVSDERYKKDIVDSTAGLSFINALQPRTFKYKTLGELPNTFRAYEADSTEVFKNSDTNHGFIAQEVKAAIDADSSIKDGFKLWDDRDDGSQEVAEAALIPILVKAIQEQQTLIEELTSRITTLEG